MPNESHRQEAAGSPLPRSGLFTTTALIVAGVLHLVIFYCARFELDSRLSEDYYLHAGRWITVGCGAIALLFGLKRVLRVRPATLLHLALLPVSAALIALPLADEWLAIADEKLPEARPYVQQVEEFAKTNLSWVIENWLPEAPAELPEGMPAEALPTRH